MDRYVYDYVNAVGYDRAASYEERAANDFETNLNPVVYMAGADGHMITRGGRSDSNLLDTYNPRYRMVRSGSGEYLASFRCVWSEH